MGGRARGRERRRVSEGRKSKANLFAFAFFFRQNLIAFETVRVAIASWNNFRLERIYSQTRNCLLSLPHFFSLPLSLPLSFFVFHSFIFVRQVSFFLFSENVSLSGHKNMNDVTEVFFLLYFFSVKTLSFGLTLTVTQYTIDLFAL